TEAHKNRGTDTYATVNSKGWKKIVIMDKLDDKYDMSTLKDVTVGVNEPDSQKASYSVSGHTLRITLKYEDDQQKPLLEQLALAGGELEIQYHAKLKNDSSLYSKDDKHPTLIKNTTKIDPNASKAMKMPSVIHYQKKIGSKYIHGIYVDGKGNKIPITESNPTYKPSKWKKLTPRDFKEAMAFCKSHNDADDAEKYNFKEKKFAEYYGSTGRHHTITNTTVNPVHVPIPMAAQKTLFEQVSSHANYQLPADRIRPNHEYYVDVTQSVGNPGDYPRGFKDFEISDDFQNSSVLTYKKAEVLKDGERLGSSNITFDGYKVTCSSE
ncbi:MAG: isopeptide-forming domain-containing fimbrial protein, partial [Lactobacillus crispatus]|nr:isopeptide-forming domain-containing fimbrial protein [Lactobacillus crispatus]